MGLGLHAARDQRATARAQASPLPLVRAPSLPCPTERLCCSTNPLAPSLGPRRAHWTPRAIWAAPVQGRPPSRARAQWEDNKRTTIQPLGEVVE